MITREGSTKSQKQAFWREFASTQHPESELKLSAAELMREGDTLAAVQQAAKGHSCSAGAGFFKRDGLLIYRRWTPPGCDKKMGMEQLVLPKVCRKTVLKLAHKIPMAGHLGKEKTSQRICRGSTGPLSIRMLHIFAEVVSDVSSQLSEECRRHLSFHCPSLVSHSKRLTLWDRFPGAGLETAVYW